MKSEKGPIKENLPVPTFNLKNIYLKENSLQIIFFEKKFPTIEFFFDILFK